MVKRRIWVIATDSSGCYYYRLHLPLTHLNSEEFEVIWRPGDGEHQPGDIVLGQRIAGHNEAWLQMCADPNITTVYDLDDNLLNIDRANTVPWSIYEPQVEGTAENIKAANVVTVSTHNLAKKILNLNLNTFVLPNYVARASLRPSAPDGFTIGWAGSMFHAQDMGGVPEQIKAFQGAHPYTKWHFIGADYSGEVVPRRVSPFQSMATYEATIDFSVGIAPLMKTPFNECKSWIKVLEYASKAIPAVASNVGQYPDFINHGSNGFLMDDVREMASYLAVLADERELAQMRAAVFESVQDYTIDRNIYRWEAVYREAAPC